MPFPFHRLPIQRSPKKLTPEERLMRYVEQKYGVEKEFAKYNKDIEDV